MTASNSVQIGDSSTIYSSTGISGSIDVTGSLETTGDLTVQGNTTINGTLTANEFHTTFTSASIILASGSTRFGDTLDDTHEFTGSVDVTGSFSLNGYSVNEISIILSFNAFELISIPSLYLVIRSLTKIYVSISLFFVIEYICDCE